MNEGLCPKCGMRTPTARKATPFIVGELWPILICTHYTFDCWVCGHTFETRVDAPYQPMEIP